MTLVLGVHGIGNHLPEMSSAAASDYLGNIWAKALPAHISDSIPIEMHMAYYADLLNVEYPQGDFDLEAFPLDLQRDLLAWAQVLGAPAEIEQGHLTLPVRQAVEWVAGKYGLEGPLVATLMGSFCWEAFAYFEDSAIRELARNHVRDMIKKCSPQIVLAHSLGSVIAYEALWEVDCPGELVFLTIGSPLGMPDIIFDRLHPAPAGVTGLRPPSVRKWINVADPGDIVAVPRGLSSRFADIDADLEASIGIFNFHTARGYLSSAAVGAVLASCQ